MRACFIAIALSAFVCGPLALAQDKPAPSKPAAAVGVSGEPFVIPGAGVTLVPPENTALARVGPTLIDPTGETIVVIAATVERLNPANNPIWQGVFPHPHEDLGTLPQGKLLHRTRAEDGGGWDGFMLNSVSNGKALHVMGMYTGSSPAALESLRKHLLTITWNPSVANAEVASGVSFRFKGLKLVEGIVGGLAYNTSGEVGGAGTAVLMQPIPVPVAKEVEIFPSNCEKILVPLMGGIKYQGPLQKKLATHSYCELWTDAPAGEGKYVAMVNLKSGGLLTVMGTAADSEFASALVVFREGVAGMKILRTP